MIINHNSCIKLVLLVIFIYDARSNIHQTSDQVSGCVECDNVYFRKQKVPSKRRETSRHIGPHYRRT